jgi:hypothetical protein
MFYIYFFAYIFSSIAEVENIYLFSVLLVVVFIMAVEVKTFLV